LQGELQEDKRTSPPLSELKERPFSVQKIKATKDLTSWAYMPFRLSHNGSYTSAS